MSGIPRPQTVPPYRLADLAALLPAALTGADVAVTGVTHASGEVRPGDLYAALPGARRHGAEFVAAAAEAGAVAVLTDPAGAGRRGRGRAAGAGRRRPARGARRGRVGDLRRPDRAADR